MEVRTGRSELDQDCFKKKGRELTMDGQFASPNGTTFSQWVAGPNKVVSVVRDTPSFLYSEQRACQSSLTTDEVALLSEEGEPMPSVPNNANDIAQKPQELSVVLLRLCRS